MNPAALTVEVSDLKVGRDGHRGYGPRSTSANLGEGGIRAQIRSRDDSLARLSGPQFDITKLTADAGQAARFFSSREAHLCRKHVGGWGPAGSGCTATSGPATIEWLQRKFAKKAGDCGPRNIAAPQTPAMRSGETAEMTGAHGRLNGPFQKTARCRRDATTAPFQRNRRPRPWGPRRGAARPRGIEEDGVRGLSDPAGIPRCSHTLANLRAVRRSSTFQAEDEIRGEWRGVGSVLRPGGARA